MKDTQLFFSNLISDLDTLVLDNTYNNSEYSVVVRKNDITKVLYILRDKYSFEQLVDVTAVDYLTYGQDEWRTKSASSVGFSRGVVTGNLLRKKKKVNLERFSVVYHLLSFSFNVRLRVKLYCGKSSLDVPTSVKLWPVADWYEREIFDLFGINFVGHPDLRRILTDYGFVGHPLRKDFPQCGYVEVRYDEEQKEIVHDAVTIDPRVTIPRIIREDNVFLKQKKD